MRCKNKKAQFYLVAAIVLVTVTVAFITIANYSQKRTPVTIYDLGEELGIESQNVLDYGTSQGGDMETLLTNFVEDYKVYAGESKNLYFIFGTEGDIQIKAYQDLIDVSEGIEYTEGAGQIVVTIEDIEYQFDLGEGQNFYFVISQEIDGEKYVAAG